VERERGDLDRERDEHREPEELLRAGIERGPTALDQLRDREGVRLAPEVEDEHRDQEQDAPRERVEEELDRGVLAPRAAPDADEEVHRQEHHLPEDVEEEEVERDEHAHHAGLEHEEEREIAFDALVDAPAREHAERTEQRRQQHHRDADAVDADEVLDVVRRDPRYPVDELEPRGAPVERAEEPGAEPERREGRRERHQADEPDVPRRQAKHDGRAQQREKRHPCENGFHGAPSRDQWPP
jgi:hypothetical protein